MGCEAEGLNRGPWGWEGNVRRRKRGRKHDAGVEAAQPPERERLLTTESRLRTSPRRGDSYVTKERPRR